MSPLSRMPPAVANFVREHEERFGLLSADATDALVHRLVHDHEQLVDGECVNLYAGTNIMNPRASALLSSTIGSRPSLGYPGDKYNKGMVHAEQVEIVLGMLLKRLFKAAFVEYRVGSGSLANLYTFMATCQPGDTILSFSDAAGGHPTHHREGAAGLYGLKIAEVPFDAQRMDIDLDGLAKAARRLRPRL